jgi:GntR family transcriptional regulator, transcriptional repressor for pyruvate dehydrogenase complex
MALTRSTDTEPTEAARADDRDRWIFHPIANARAHEAVIEQITFAVRAGAFAPGDRLPNIDKLSKAMHVSKPVIGEALKVLSRSGVLHVQRGINGGLTVLTTEIPPGIMALGSPAPHLSIAEIVEARRPVEIALAVLAGERADEDDFEMLESCVDALRTLRRAALEKRIRYDHLFHYIIGRAARSQALALYQHQILEQLFLRMKSYFKDIEDVDSVIVLHADTLAALRTRDRTTIEQAIDRHLRPLEQAVAAREKIDAEAALAEVPAG